MSANNTEHEDVSIGQIALTKGFITQEQLREAVFIQRKLQSMGLPTRKLGEILTEKKFLSNDQIEKLLSAQQSIHKSRNIAGYEIIEKLGQGGMGVVYKARQVSMGRVVALKVLPSKLAQNNAFIKRFLREARASAKLNHINIITGIDVGMSGGLYYFAMEYVDGESLDKIIERDGTLEESKALEIGLQISYALEHADKAGFVHRDIKPQNIILSSAGVAKLCDLGLARERTSGGDATGESNAIGTPHYISPEQAKGEVADIRSDIYSLGATLYHLVTGSVPFKGASPMVVMTKHLTDPLTPPRKRNADLSKKINELIVKMMSKSPDERHQTPLELIRDIKIAKHQLASGKKGKAGSKRRGRTTRPVPVSRPTPRAAQPLSEPPLKTEKPLVRSNSRSGHRKRVLRTVGGSPTRKKTYELALFIVGVIIIAIFIILLLMKTSGRGKNNGDSSFRQRQNPLSILNVDTGFVEHSEPLGIEPSESPAV